MHIAEQFELGFIKQTMEDRLKKLIAENSKFGNSSAVSAYRMTLAAIQEEINRGKTLKPIDEENIVVKVLKMFEESFEVSNDPEDNIRASYVEKLLPKRIPKEKYDEILDAKIEFLNISSRKDIGKLMKALKDEFGNKLDYSIVFSKIDKKL